jgi:hypothetical protein
LGEGSNEVEVKRSERKREEEGNLRGEERFVRTVSLSLVGFISWRVEGEDRVWHMQK